MSRVRKGLGVSNISELRSQRKSILELRVRSGRLAATVEIPTPRSNGAVVTLKQKAWTAAELQRLARVIKRAAEKLEG